MHQHNLVARAGFLGLMLMSCTSGASLPPASPTPNTPGEIVPGPFPVQYLDFSPGTYQYQVIQTTEVQVAGSPDTVPSMIMTRALLIIAVSSRTDSAIELIVSIDSIIVTSQGSIPPRGLTQISSLDSILHIVFTPTSTVAATHLADSLCEYSQFIGMARDVIVPELALRVQTSTKGTHSDTTIVISCRAGINIETVTTRHVRNLGGEPPAFSIDQKAELRGTGLLRRDSITVTGSTSIHGAASFLHGNRLPSVVQTRSDGLITVQLGDSTTVFHQSTNQEIHLRGKTIPN